MVWVNWSWNSKAKETLINLAVFLWADQLGPIVASHEKRASSDPRNQLVGLVGLQAKLKAPAMLQSARVPGQDVRAGF